MRLRLFQLTLSGMGGRYSMTSEDIVKSLTRLETKLEAFEQSFSELKTDLKTPKTPVLPVTGGLAGLVAAVWTGYLQASGKA